MYVFRENKTDVIWGKLDGQDYVVQEEKESAKKMTYQQWHEALGHPSADYLKSNNYSDATNLPKVPKAWQCEICITSKGTKRSLPQQKTPRHGQKLHLSFSILTLAESSPKHPSVNQITMLPSSMTVVATPGYIPSMLNPRLLKCSPVSSMLATLKITP